MVSELFMELILSPFPLYHHNGSQELKLLGIEGYILILQFFENIDFIHAIVLLRFRSL